MKNVCILEAVQRSLAIYFIHSLEYLTFVKLQFFDAFFDVVQGPVFQRFHRGSG